MSEKKLRVVAHITSKPERVDDTKQALLKPIEPTRVESGCVSYELLQNKADRTDFTFVEEWKCEEDLAAHFETDHLKEILAKADDLLAAPPDIRRYTIVA
jgi:quinol monooxygenase YgiN